MANVLEQSDLPLVHKLGHVLNRLNVAMRADSWDAFSADGLNPTQGQIVMLLGRRGASLRLTEIADELAVSAPTVSDSVSSLVDKGLVKKERASDDGRAVAVSLTARGKKRLERLDILGEAVGSAIASLPEPDQIQLYSTLLRMIRELQRSGRIPVSRMCVTCKYFRPNAHSDETRPHHCALVDASFGDRTIRSDCADHEAADSHLADQIWSSLTSSA